MKTRIMIVLAILLLIGASAATNEQCGAINGKVIQQKGKLPISGAKLECYQNSKLISSTLTDAKGAYRIDKLLPGKYELKASSPNYKTYTRKITVKTCKTTTVNIKLKAAVMQRENIVTPPTGSTSKLEMTSVMDMAGSGGIANYATPMPYGNPGMYQPPNSTEDYSAITPNIFHSPLSEPLSTFSIDVDTANYSNLRRMLNQGQLPPSNSIRLEELLNYFSYNYPAPTAEHPFSVYSEMGVIPWNQKRNFVHIGIQGKKLNLDVAPASNLVFLIDVSGSMDSPNKLGLVKESMNLLVENLRGKDKVAIVVYAGAAGEILPSTSGNNKLAITEALNKLQAGGSTAGGAGIQLAYKIATENLIKDGNNRIIICTDGDFNVGASSDAAMTELVETNRKKGIYLTVLGYGMGNYKDNRMELLADKGNGNYAYIDTIQEAKKVLVNEMVSTLYTIAKDVKLQVEFNPAHVKAYRLVGYENRLLRDEDFVDDTKDAGELGAGHTVTAIYEIIPADSKESFPGEIPLKYQDIKISDEARKSPEIMTVKLRYKLPDKDLSIPFDVPVKNVTKALNDCSETYLFSTAVLGYGMMLQNSEYKAALTWDMVKELAKNNIGKDVEGYRAEFLKLIDTAAKLQEQQQREENRDFNKGE
ncbi:VWA domain-containing protein [Candidatus Cloacimonadota bacterium]